VSRELPAGAVARAAGSWPGGTWESALTCPGFAAVRGVGFEPPGGCPARLSRGAAPLSGLECTAAGTAVRAPGAAHGRRELFTGDVCGQDVATLVTAGAGAGRPCARHLDRVPAR